MNSKFSLRGMFALVAIIALGLGVWWQAKQGNELKQLRADNARLKEEISQRQFELDIARIDTHMKVPTEALYYKQMPRAELHRLRWDALEAVASDTFVPVYSLYEHSPERPYARFGGERSMETWKTTQGSFWEGYGINNAGRGASMLNNRISSSPDFRERLLADRKLTEEYFKPLLLRMVRSPHQGARLAALESMLLLGDRSNEIGDLIRADFERVTSSPPRGLTDGITIGDEYARDLAREYARLLKLYEGSEESAN